MTALASVFLVLAAVTALGLVIAITWHHYDRLTRANERLRAENRRLNDLVGHVCWERDQALQRAASADDERQLVLHTHLALFDPEMRTS